MSVPGPSRPGCLAAAVLSLLPAAAPAETYRWTDDRGGVNYSDRVPPEQARNRRARLNSLGFEVEVLEAPKTREQLQREQLLQQLRAQQEKVLSEQREQDRALMRTYRSSDEILAALKIKLDGLDGSIKLTEASLQRDQAHLRVQDQRVRDLGARGQPVPEPLRQSLHALGRRLDAYRAQMQRLENEKLATVDRYNRDLRRFQAIRAMQARNENPNADWTHAVVKASGDSNSDILISAVECADTRQCDRYWELARELLGREYGYRVSVDTDKILQTPYPRNETDFGITITRIPGNPHQMVFMDVICRPTTIGEQLCKSERARELHERFRASMALPAAGAATGTARPGVTTP